MKALFRIGPLGAASSFALVLAVAALAAPGDLDPAFGTNGRVILSPGIESYAAAATLQPDGKLLLAGLVDDRAPPPPPPPAPDAFRIPSGDFLAVRLGANGSPDASFGTGGVVRTPIDLGISGYDVARAVATGPGGRVVLAGDAGTAEGALDLAFVRYTSSGALDSSFSDDGIQTVDVGTFDSVSGVAVQTDGKVVAAGRGGSGFTLVRLRADGSLDPAFGSGGIVDTPIGDPSVRDEASAVTLLGDGRILVAGTADYYYDAQTDFALVRYLPSGELDPSFGSGGIVVTRAARDDVASAMALTPSGGIVVAGYGGGGAFRLVRYLRGGALDPSFGRAGVVTTRIGTLYADAHAVWVQADGRVIAGGTTRDRPPAVWDEMAVVRYDVDGSPDTSFGQGGKRTFDLLAGHDLGWALVVQPGSGGSPDRLIQAGRASEGDGLAEHVAAIGIELGPLAPPPPPIRCRVPRVVHQRLATARSRIKRAHCSVGRIRRVRRPRLRGIVVAQSPRAGRRLASGARVNLVVGRR